MAMAILTYVPFLVLKNKLFDSPIKKKSFPPTATLALQVAVIFIPCQGRPKGAPKGEAFTWNEGAATKKLNMGCCPEKSFFRFGSVPTFPIDASSKVCILSFVQPSNCLSIDRCSLLLSCTLHHYIEQLSIDVPDTQKIAHCPMS